MNASVETQECHRAMRRVKETDDDGVFAHEIYEVSKIGLRKARSK